MARTPSTMLPLGTPLPAFALPDFDGRRIATEDLADAPALLVMFICNHCPYVKLVADELARLTSEYAKRGLAAVGINSNDFVAHPDDAPPAMKVEAALRGYCFPYLVDESQDVARSFQAACTPDIYLFDGARRLVYRGQLDGARPGNGVAVDGIDLRTALDCVLSGKTPSMTQKASIGCNIKWRLAVK